MNALAMFKWCCRLLVAAGLAGVGTAAQAAITCSIAAPAPMAFAYVASTNTASANNVQQGSISVTCTRTAAADPTTLNLAANNGLYSSGQVNNVQLAAGGSNYLVSYDLYQDSLCSTDWRASNNGQLSATLLSTALNTPVTATFRYWACKTSAQVLTGYPAGYYTDRADLTLLAAGTSVATASLNVGLYAPAVCSISNGPANITFTYAAFAPSAVFAGSSFKANCTNLLPYTVSLSPTVGVVAGLRYSLGLSLSTPGSAANPGPPSLSTQGNATGSAVHYINGAMPAGQPGQTGDVVPQIHTLTITY